MRIRPQICLLLGLFALGALALGDDALSTEAKAVLDRVTERWKSADALYPDLRNKVSEVFSKLSAVQMQDAPPGTIMRNFVTIVSSPIVNAFVIKTQTPGMSRIENQVFVTTGALELLYSAQATGAPEGDTRKIMQGAERLLAVLLGHELRHPVTLGRGEVPSSLQERYQRDHLLEFDADLGGETYAERAGYPRGGAAWLLTVLGSLSKPDSNILGSALSSHPHSAARASAARIFKASRRYRAGAEKPLPPDERGAFQIWKSVLKLRTDVAAARKKEEYSSLYPQIPVEDWTFREPRSLEEIASRLDTLLEPSPKGGLRWVSTLNQHYASVEANRLLLSVEGFLRGLKPEQLSVAEREAFQRVRGFVEKVSPYSYKDMAENFTAERKSLEFLKKMPWSEFVSTHPIFRTKENVERYIPKVESSVNSTYSALARGEGESYIATRARDFLPMSVILANPQVKRMLEHDYSFDRTISAFERGTVADQMLFADALLSQVLGQPNFANDGSKGAETSYGLQHKLRLVWGNSDGERGGAQAFHMAAADIDSRFIRASPLEKERAQRLQKNLVRKLLFEYGGLLGTADLLNNRNTIPWSRYFEILGMKPEAGARILNAKMREFARTRELEVVFAKAGNQRVESKTSASKFRYDNKNQVDRFWVDEGLVRLYNISSNEAARVFRNAAMDSSRTFFESQLERHLGQALAEKTIPGKPRDAGWIAQTTSRFLTANDLRAEERYSGLPIAKVWMKALRASVLAPAEKREVLRALFFGDPASRSRPFSSLFWVDGTEGKNAVSESDFAESAKLAREIQAMGGMSSASELMRSRLAVVRGTKVPKDSREGNPVRRSYVDMVARLAPLLTEELEKDLAKEPTPEGKGRILRRFVQDFVNPTRVTSKKQMGRIDLHERLHDAPGSATRSMNQKVLELAEKSRIPGPDRAYIHEQMTFLQSPTPGTDDIVRKRIDDLLKQPLNSRTERELREYLDENRLWNDKLKVRIAEKLFTRSFLAGRRPPSEAEAMFNTLQRWVPTTLLEKDALLEKIAWRYQLTGDSLRILEEAKTGNWKLSNPGTVRLGSAGAEILVKMNDRARVEFILWLTGSLGKDLPSSVENEIARLFREEGNRYLSPGTQQKLRQKTAEAEAQRWKKFIEASLLDLKAEEKVPLLEMALAAGPRNLAEVSAAELDRIMSKGLRLSPKSKEGRLLKIFLNRLPADERAAHLSYLLAQTGKEGVDAARIYEAIGPFGIRMAQMVQRWDLFGREHSDKLRRLTHKARAMSLFEIQEAVEAHPDLKALIAEYLEVKGCGTNRCAVEVRLKNGRKSMLMVQRPDAAAQIEGMFEMAEGVLKDAIAEKLTENLEMAEILLRDLRPQMLSELDGVREVATIERVQRAVEFLSQDPEIRTALNGRELVVPGLEKGTQAYNDMFLMEHFDGETFGDRHMGEIGEAIVRLNTKMRLEMGAGDADRHRGQYLVSKDGKRIGLTDTAGWWYEFNNAELGHWLNFIKASSEGNSGAIFDATAAMCKEGCAQANREAVTRALDAAIAKAGTDAKARAIGMVQALESNGMKIDPKFKYGGIMETLTQRAERFVPEERFDAILKAQATKTFLGRMFGGMNLSAAAQCLAGGLQAIAHPPGQPVR